MTVIVTVVNMKVLPMTQVSGLVTPPPVYMAEKNKKCYKQ